MNARLDYAASLRNQTYDPSQEARMDALMQEVKDRLDGPGGTNSENSPT